MSTKATTPIWIMRDYRQCSGCRTCEVACSLHHEGKIWPEASRIRVFMLVPGAEVPQVCAQCHDYPCLTSCPVKAISWDSKLGRVLVDAEKCTSCGKCIKACPGNIPFLHPGNKKAMICDLCDGDPECVKICLRGRWNTLWVVPRAASVNYRLYAKKPDEITKELAENLYGSQRAKELI